jgi:hypothetical protein
MVGAFDAGLQHGVGLFETLLAVRDGDGSRVLVDAPKLNRSGSSRNGFDGGSTRGIASGGLAPSKKVSIGNI